MANSYMIQLNDLYDVLGDIRELYNFREDQKVDIVDYMDNIHEFERKEQPFIEEIYKKITSKGENFENVLIALYYTGRDYNHFYDCSPLLLYLDYINNSIESPIETLLSKSRPIEFIERGLDLVSGFSLINIK